MTEPGPTSCACLIHRQEWTGEPDVDDVVAKVRKRRWAIVGDERHNWSCTVGGAHNFAFPEFVICGRSRPERAHILRNALIAAEHDLPRLGEVDTELTFLKVKTVRVHGSWHGSPLLRTARAFYGELPEYRQLLWAEGDEGFPGDENFPRELLDRQPDLAIPRPDHPQCVWTTL